MRERELEREGERKREALSHPALHGLLGHLALANAAPARPALRPTVQATWADETVATRGRLSETGALVGAPETPEEERGSLRRGTGEAEVCVRVQGYCMGRGWWLGCTQELFEGQGQAHMASIRAMLKSRHVEEGDVGQSRGEAVEKPWSSKATNNITGVVVVL